VKANILEELDSKLRTEGFEKYQTTLGGDGVGVLWPAVVGGSETEITQEMFLGAEGVEGVEALVGVGAIGKGIKGWRFWREWIAEGSDFCLH